MKMDLVDNSHTKKIVSFRFEFLWFLEPSLMLLKLLKRNWRWFLFLHRCSECCWWLSCVLFISTQVETLNYCHNPSPIPKSKSKVQFKSQDSKSKVQFKSQDSKSKV